MLDAVAGEVLEAELSQGGPNVPQSRLAVRRLKYPKASPRVTTNR
jgi:hypothetical protein